MTVNRDWVASLALASALAVCGPALAQGAPMVGMAMKAPQAKSDLAHALVGTWRVTSFLRTDQTTHKVTYPVGQHPTGYMVFTLGGHMAVMITAGAGDRKTPKLPYSVPDRAAVMLDIAAAYVGPYKLKGNTLTVHEVTTLRPDNMGVDSDREIALKGNTLTVTNAPTKNSVTGTTGTAVMIAVRED